MGMLKWEETPGQTQDSLGSWGGGILSGLEMPWDAPEAAAGDEDV